MKQFLHHLKAFVRSNPIRFGEADPVPALELLYWEYISCHRMTDEKAKQASADLAALLRSLPSDQQEQITSHAWQLCAEHERLAFIAGVQLGAQLMMELTEEYANQTPD